MKRHETGSKPPELVAAADVADALGRGVSGDAFAFGLKSRTSACKSKASDHEVKEFSQYLSLITSPFRVESFYLEMLG